MTLRVVWRNPKPLIRTKQTIRRIEGDQSGAVYVVTTRDSAQEFSLISGKVA